MNRSIRFTNRTSNGRKRAVPCTIAGRPRRSAFTLVELLVVITIIGMLTGLLLPAVNMAREAGRRATCTNNQHQISLAMMNFESARRYFPGYIGYVGSNGYPVSWVVSVFPYLERTDLYNIWANGIEVTPGTITYPQPGWGSSSPIPTTSPNSVLYENAYKYNSILVCPSDPPPSKGNNETWLSYVCNRGVNHRTDIANDTRFNDDFPVPNSSVALGICMDFAPYANWQGGIMNMIGLDYITGHDGAAFTLILSESLFSDPGTQPMYLFESGNSSQSNVRSNPRWTCAQGASEKTQVNLGFE